MLSPSFPYDHTSPASGEELKKRLATRLACNEVAAL